MTYVKVGKQYANADLCFDWKASPEAVMEAVAKKLAIWGLEVKSHETGGSDIGFTISKKKKAAKKVSTWLDKDKPKLVVGPIWHQYRAVVHWVGVNGRTDIGVEFQNYRGKDKKATLVFGAHDDIPKLREVIMIRWYPYAKQWMRVPDHKV